MQYLPAPGDYFLDTDGALRNYADENFIRNLEQRFTARVDHNLTRGNRLTGRYTQVPIRGDRGRSGFEVGRDEVNTGGTDYSWSRQLLFTDTPHPLVVRGQRSCGSTTPTAGSRETFRLDSTPTRDGISRPSSGCRA